MLFKKHFEGYGVAAAAAGVEEIAIALPFPVVVAHGVRVILAADRDGEAFKLEPFGLLSVPLGFLDLANHAIVHCVKSPFVSLLGWDAQRHTGFRVPYFGWV